MGEERSNDTDTHTMRLVIRKVVSNKLWWQEQRRGIPRNADAKTTKADWNPIES